MITKLRTAKMREYDCAECNAKIVKESKYYDSDEKLDEKKPFPTKKYCKACGDKKQG